MNIQNRQPVEVTEKEERVIRKEISEWIVSKNVHSQNKQLHLPDNGRPFCESGSGGIITGSDSKPAKFTSKSVEIFPVGYRDICTLCGYMWRQENNEAVTND